MPKKTNKSRSREHEGFIAKSYGGRVSPSSGAAATDNGDVRTEETIFECKTTGTVEKPAKSTLVTRMEKVADEAYSEGKEPALALRFYKPESKLADNKGYIDLIVRLVKEDVWRSSSTNPS